MTESDKPAKRSRFDQTEPEPKRSRFDRRSRSPPPHRPEARERSPLPADSGADSQKSPPDAAAAAGELSLCWPLVVMTELTMYVQRRRLRGSMPNSRRAEVSSMLMYPLSSPRLLPSRQCCQEHPLPVLDPVMRSTERCTSMTETTSRILKSTT